MKTIRFIIILLIQISICTKSYSQANDNNIRECVKSFYSLLFANDVTIGQLRRTYANGGLDNEAQQIICDSLKTNYYDYSSTIKEESRLNDNSPSFIIKQIKQYSKELTQGLTLNQIYDLIDTAEISDQGLELDNYLQIKFSKRKSIYFDLNKDNPSQINWIYLSNGDLLEGKLYNNNPEKLQLVGEISDPDGYVNVRTNPSVKSQIVSKIFNGSYFFYTPDNDIDWWLVRKKENGSPLGYIHKSRIKNYVYFSEELKKRVEKDRN